MGRKKKNYMENQTNNFPQSGTESQMNSQQSGTESQMSSQLNGTKSQTPQNGVLIEECPFSKQNFPVNYYVWHVENIAAIANAAVPRLFLELVDRFRVYGAFGAENNLMQRVEKAETALRMAAMGFPSCVAISLLRSSMFTGRNIKGSELDAFLNDTEAVNEYMKENAHLMPFDKEHMETFYKGHGTAENNAVVELFNMLRNKYSL